MPRNLERGQAIDYLDEIRSTYKKAKDFNQLGEPYENFETVINLINLQRAMLLVSGEQAITIVPISSTGFPSLASVISDAEKIINIYNPLDENMRQVIPQIFNDVANINTSSLLEQEKGRTEAFAAFRDFLKQSELSSQEIRSVEFTVMYWKNPQQVLSKYHYGEITTVREVRGLLIPQGYELRDKKWKDLRGYKFIFIPAGSSKNGLWQSFFAIFDGGEEEELKWDTIKPNRASAAKSDEERSQPGNQLDNDLSEIKQGYYSYYNAERKVLNRLLRNIDPTTYPEHNVIIFETLLRVLKDLTTIRNFSWRTKKEILPEIGAKEFTDMQLSLAESLRKLNDLPPEVSNLIRAAIKDWMQIEIERWNPSTSETDEGNILSVLVKKITKR